jgi:hypothetical protein
MNVHNNSFCIQTILPSQALQTAHKTNRVSFNPNSHFQVDLHSPSDEEWTVARTEAKQSQQFVFAYRLGIVNLSRQ